MFPIFKNAAIVPSKKRKVNVCLSPKDYLNTTASSIIKNLYHLSPAGLTNIFAAAILDSMKKKWILVSITVAAVLAYWLLFSGISADELDTFIRGFGPWAPLAYVAAFTVLPAFFFPVAVLALPTGPMPTRVTVRTPKVQRSGGLSAPLVALADILPAESFCPEEEANLST